MATVSQIQASISAKIKVIDQAWKYAQGTTGEVFSGHATSHERAYRATLQDDYAYKAQMETSLARFRGGIDGILALGADLLNPDVLEYGRIIRSRSTDVNGIWRDIRDHMVANGQHVTSRSLVMDTTPAKSSPFDGDGQLFRLLVDADDFTIENVHAETKKIRCVNDRHSGGSQQRQFFAVFGETPAPDRLSMEGSGARAILGSINSEDAEPYFENPSFSFVTGTSPVSAIRGWTLTSGLYSDIHAETTTTYRPKGPTEQTAQALRITGDVTLNQKFSLTKLRANPRIPYYNHIAVEKRTASAGTITFLVGAVNSGVINLTSLASGWNLIRVPNLANVGGDENWYHNFGDMADPSITIAISGLTGEILLDDICFAPMNQVDGAWMSVIGGPTEFRLDDEFVITDTDPGLGINQYWIWRIYGFTMPSKAVGAEWPDAA